MWEGNNNLLEGQSGDFLRPVCRFPSAAPEGEPAGEGSPPPSDGCTAAVVITESKSSAVDHDWREII